MPSAGCTTDLEVDLEVRRTGAARLDQIWYANPFCALTFGIVVVSELSFRIYLQVLGGTL